MALMPGKKSAPSVKTVPIAAAPISVTRTPTRPAETAIVVCYARPFSPRNAVGALGTRWEPLQSYQTLHAELMRLRNQVYAHTDETGARQVVDVSDLLGLDSPAYAEGWQPIEREALPAIVQLARALESCLASAVDERLSRLAKRGAGPSR